MMNPDPNLSVIFAQDQETDTQATKESDAIYKEKQKRKLMSCLTLVRAHYSREEVRHLYAHTA